MLGIERPNDQLPRYVDRDGQPLKSMWIATEEDKRSVAPERWQHLVAVLFYLAWSRSNYLILDCAAAEDFYFEAFSVPEGAPNDTSHGLTIIIQGGTSINEVWKLFLTRFLRAG